MNDPKSKKIAVIGLGYVGLPVALGFAEKFDVIGFDIDQKRVGDLTRGHDWSGETTSAELLSSKARFSADEAALKDRSVFIVCVPTPIDAAKNPDFRPLISASQTVGRAIQKGGIACFESTVFPGATEDICGPAIAKLSGLKCGTDFTLGYSPERINPGDKEHTLQTITKVVAGQDTKTADLLCALYSAIIPAGIHRAPSIRVAEAAKVIENTQRDLNIALMNELSIIFDKMGIRTKDVLDAAGTKWNFLKFTPGLVGGHCIGVDPYYLTSKSEELGYFPEVILAGRRINDGMGAFIARKMIEFLSLQGHAAKHAKIGILGITFKENVTDIRNSRVPDIVTELNRYGVSPLIADPHANPDMVLHEYGLKLAPLSALTDLDGMVLAVPHASFLDKQANLLSRLKPGAPLIDIKSVLPRETPGLWSL